MAQPARPTIPITPDQSVWQKANDELILPSGMTKEEAFEKHSKPNGLTTYDPSWPVQLIAHRGVPHNYGAVPDGSTKALLEALKFGSNVEFDVEFMGDVPYVFHDKAGDRQTFVKGQMSACKPEDDRALLQYIIRDVEGGNYTSCYIPTDQAVMPLMDVLNELLRVKPEATLFIDARNQDGARATAFLSRHSGYTNNVVVQFYPYTFTNGAEFVQLTKEYGAVPCWKKLVSLAPILNPDQLFKLANVTTYSDDYGALLQAGIKWFDSMFTADLKIFAVGLLACGFGENYDLDTRKAFDLNGEEVGDPLARASCLWDRVLLGLMDWMRENHPHIPIIGVCISPSYVWEGIKYTNSFHTGFPVRWKDGPAGHATELRAIPGHYLKLSNNRRFNFVTCDRLDANLSALLGTKVYKWPKDVWHYNQQAFRRHLINPSAKLVHAEHYEPGDYTKHTTARCVHRYTLHASV